MKKSILLVALLSVLISLISSCQNDDDISMKQTKDGITIVNGVIVKPKWLKRSVDSVAKSHHPSEFGTYFYPMVHKAYHKGEKYLIIMDPVKSTMDHLVLTLTGERVPVEKAWDIIFEKNKVLIWFERTGNPEIDDPLIQEIEEQQESAE